MHCSARPILGCGGVGGSSNGRDVRFFVTTVRQLVSGEFPPCSRCRWKPVPPDADPLAALADAACAEVAKRLGTPANVTILNEAGLRGCWQRRRGPTRAHGCRARALTTHRGGGPLRPRRARAGPTRPARAPARRPAATWVRC